MVQEQNLEGLGVLVGGSGHDLNTLLVPMLGNAELALESLDCESNTYSMVR